MTEEHEPLSDVEIAQVPRDCDSMEAYGRLDIAKLTRKLLAGLLAIRKENERLQAVVAALAPKCWRLNEQGKLVKDKPVSDGMSLFELGRAPTPCREPEIRQITARLPRGDKYHSSYDTLEAAETAEAEG